jgi:hypothetical protein
VLGDLFEERCHQHIEVVDGQRRQHPRSADDIDADAVRVGVAHSCTGQQFEQRAAAELPHEHTVVDVALGCRCHVDSTPLISRISPETLYES